MSKQKELTPEELEQRERMKQVLDFYNLDRLQFAEKTRTKLGYVNQMLSGKRPVSEIVMRRFCAMYQKVNLEWLMDGIGEMLLPAQAEEIEFRTVSEAKAEYVLDPFLALRRLLEEHHAEIEALKDRVGEMEKKLNSEL